MLQAFTLHKNEEKIISKCKLETFQSDQFPSQPQLKKNKLSRDEKYIETY